MELPLNRINYYGDVFVSTVVIEEIYERKFCSLTEVEAKNLVKMFG